MDSDMERSPAEWPPLGMPTGSVRALLTLIVVAVVVTDLARGTSVDVLWIETLLMALAHYFTSRRFAALPPNLIRKLEADGVLDQERHPLFLPRHSIRFIILAAFIGLGAYLYRENRLWEPQAISLLGMVAAYLLGALIRTVTGWWNRWRNRRPWRFWADARAVIVLVGVVVVAVPELVGVPVDLPSWAFKAGLGLLLFYFGSR